LASSLPYYVRRAAQERQARAAEAAVLARQQRLWKKARSTAALLATADAAYKEGRILAASKIYCRMASGRPPNGFSVAARQRLDRLAEDARGKLGEVDAKLSQQEMAPDLIEAVFDEYSRLSKDYGGVPAVRREIRSHVARQRRRPEYAKVLNEPEAEALWESAQEHEARDHPCCAYWIYQRAARLTPAPSGERALKQLTKMNEDPRLVAAAELCRRLQECHGLFSRAERVIKANPARARELFRQIVDRAPEDSEVHLAARRQIRQMTSPK
jgi:hypothetical protein